MLSECATKPVVQLLQHIVQIQRKDGAGKIIQYKGVEMGKTATAAVHYSVKRPVIGSVPWIIILVFIMLIRSIHSYLLPNKLYAVIVAFAQNHADEDGIVDIENPLH